MELAIRKREFGKTHPATLDTLSKVSRIKSELGMLK